MRSQKVKDYYFLLIYHISKPNYYRYKIINSFKKIQKKNMPNWLNLGSGHHYFDRFINIEGNVCLKKDIWLDIRLGLPFPTDSIDAIYASNFFEHFLWLNF